MQAGWGDDPDPTIQIFVYGASRTIQLGRRGKETRKAQIPSNCCVSFVLGDYRLAFVEVCLRAGGNAKAEQVKKRGSSKLVSWPKEMHSAARARIATPSHKEMQSVARARIACPCSSADATFANSYYSCPVKVLDE